MDGRRVIVDADGPREVALSRATETVVPAAPARPAPRRRPGARAPRGRRRRQRARPPSQRRPRRLRQPLGRGFRGLEFD
ncbi:MAG: hypothetical protein R3F43_01635 [bacterium]